MKFKQAFSLVELSIVLVILGLLTGGILTGQSLIRAAELRSVTTEYNNYQTAAMTFRDKYFAIPGDMNNAQAFWTATVGNGDGDGILEVTSATPGDPTEQFGFWEHLNRAGLVEGNFDGLSGAGGSGFTAVLGVNVPQSKLGNAGWSTANLGTVAIADTVFYEGNYGNVYIFGNALANDRTRAPALSSEEAWNIDTKIDDARPGLGRLRTLEADGGATAGARCGNAAAAATALAPTVDYDLTATGEECTLVFLM